MGHEIDGHDGWIMETPSGGVILIVQLMGHYQLLFTHIKCELDNTKVIL